MAMGGFHASPVELSVGLLWRRLRGLPGGLHLQRRLSLLSVIWALAGDWKDMDSRV